MPNLAVWGCVSLRTGLQVLLGHSTGAQDAVTLLKDSDSCDYAVVGTVLQVCGCQVNPDCDKQNPQHEWHISSTKGTINCGVVSQPGASGEVIFVMVCSVRFLSEPHIPLGCVGN